MTFFDRWIAAIMQTPAAKAIMDTDAARKGALGLAGLAAAGGAVAGPALSASQPAQQMNPIAAVAQENAPSAKEINNYQYERQPNFYYCGPASTRIAASADGEILSQDELAEKLGTTTNGTNSAEDITRVLNDVTGSEDYRTVEIPNEEASAEQTDRLKADLVDSIRNGDPAVVNIIGTATDVDGNEHSLPTGHYLTVVGYRDGGDTVKIADPWETRGDGTYWMTTNTLADWAGSRGYSA